jgi:hypothetical protein
VRISGGRPFFEDSGEDPFFEGDPFGDDPSFKYNPCARSLRPLDPFFFRFVTKFPFSVTSVMGSSFILLLA